MLWNLLSFTPDKEWWPIIRASTATYVINRAGVWTMLSDQGFFCHRYLNYSLTKVRSQDSLSVIVYVSRNIHGRYLAWNFVRANSDYILKV